MVTTVEAVWVDARVVGGDRHGTVRRIKLATRPHERVVVGDDGDGVQSVYYLVDSPSDDGPRYVLLYCGRYVDASAGGRR